MAIIHLCLVFYGTAHMRINRVFYTAQNKSRLKYVGNSSYKRSILEYTAAYFSDGFTGGYGGAHPPGLGQGVQGGAYCLVKSLVKSKYIEGRIHAMSV